MRSENPTQTCHDIDVLFVCLIQVAHKRSVRAAEQAKLVSEILQIRRPSARSLFSNDSSKGSGGGLRLRADNISILSAPPAPCANSAKKSVGTGKKPAEIFHLTAGPADSANDDETGSLCGSANDISIPVPKANKTSKLKNFKAKYLSIPRNDTT